MRQYELWTRDELPQEETEEEKHARIILKATRYSGGDQMQNAKNSKSYVLEGLTLKEIDISEELERQRQVLEKIQRDFEQKGVFCSLGVNIDSKLD